MRLPVTVHPPSGLRIFCTMNWRLFWTAIVQDDIDAFIAKTQALSAELEAEMHNGRDQLLELNSCRKELADELIDQLNAYEKEGVLWPYMEDVFECYGVDTEFHSPDCFIVRPSDHLRVSHFPGID